jgi:hypothetical protein
VTVGEIQEYPDGTPAAGDKVPFVSDPAGTPALMLADVSDLGGGDRAITRYLGGSDLSTTSTSFVDIDATNLPALSLTLAVGDLVELTFVATWAHGDGGRLIGFDWLIDQPTSGNTNLRDTSYAAGLWEPGVNGYDANTAPMIGYFTATEAGVHTFLPQWRTSTGTAYIRQTGTYYSPIVHIVKNLG